MKFDKLGKEQGHANPELILNQNSSMAKWDQMNDQQAAQINNFLEFLWVMSTSSK